jgi:caa(3)-type oxidase subunit IV
VSSQAAPSHRIGLRAYVATYLALLVLATLSWQVTGLPAAAGLPLALAIGVVKALLVLFVFMHLIEERFSVKFAMLVALVMVSILVGLTVLDPLTRAPYPPAPQQNANYAGPREHVGPLR